MKRLICVLSLCLTMGAAAETLKGACEVAFNVTETMNRKFSGSGTAEPFQVEVTPAGGQRPASWKMEVQPAKLSTKKAARDAEMWKMFRLTEFAAASGEVKAFDLEQLKKAATETVEIPFTLTIVGVARELKATVSNVKEEKDTISFDADFVVDMKSFTLKPKVMLGIFRVGNEVKVRSTFTLTR